MIHLWISSEYRHEPWSIYEHLDELSVQFTRVRLPSTTTRLPRSLKQYNNFKASEFRILLLFGYIIFHGFLHQNYYDHLLQFVSLLHLAESRSISHENLDVMQALGENFVVSFARLYTDRHCVQVVHSVIHIAATVRDYGPLTRYTTFNFENHLGKIFPCKRKVFEN